MACEEPIDAAGVSSLLEQAAAELKEAIEIPGLDTDPKRMKLDLITFEFMVIDQGDRLERLEMALSSLFPVLAFLTLAVWYLWTRRDVRE